MPKQLSVGLYFKPKVVRTLARCPQMTTGGTSERAHNWQLCNIIIQRVALRVAPISPKVLLSPNSLSVSFGDHCRPRSCRVPLFGRTAKLKSSLLSFSRSITDGGGI